MSVLKCTLPLEKEMQVVAQSREVSADERRLCSSRQAAQMHKTSVLYIYLVHVHVHTCIILGIWPIAMAGRKTVDPTPTSSVKPTKEVLYLFLHTCIYCGLFVYVYMYMYSLYMYMNENARFYAHTYM